MNNIFIEIIFDKTQNLSKAYYHENNKRYELGPKYLKKVELLIQNCDPRMFKKLSNHTYTFHDFETINLIIRCEKFARQVSKRKVLKTKIFAGALVVTMLASVGTLVSASKVKATSSDIEFIQEESINKELTNDVVYIMADKNTDNVPVEKESSITDNVSVSEIMEKDDKNVNEELVNEVVETDEINEEKNYNSFDLNYEDRTNSSKYEFVLENYKDTIEKYSEIYGLDSTLIIALATQESGYNSNEPSETGGYGLMQIQKCIWDGNPVTAFNHITNEEETIIVDGSRLTELDYNIKVGCMIFSEFLKMQNYDIIIGLQSYNFGCYGVDQVVDYYCDSCGTTRENLENKDYNWLNYRSSLGLSGDPEYIEHVLSYVPNNSVLKFLTENKNEVAININNVTIQNDKIL